MLRKGHVAVTHPVRLVESFNDASHSHSFGSESAFVAGEWDQFKANAELFGYVSTFKAQWGRCVQPVIH